MLITVRDITRVEITTEIFETMEDAYTTMQKRLYKVLDDETSINILEMGCDLSNGGISDNSAWAVMDFGDTKYNWKIVEI